MEEENLKKYLYEMNRAIRSGNPRFMSYVSREYMKYQKNAQLILKRGQITYDKISNI